MNLTVLENRLAAFNDTMKSIADDLHHFRDLIDKEIAEKEARKNEHDLAHNFIAHKGDNFTVCDDFTIPATEEDVDPDNRPTPNIMKKSEPLIVEKVDCLSSKYDVAVTVLRKHCGTSVVFTLDQIRKLIENDLIAIRSTGIL